MKHLSKLGLVLAWGMLLAGPRAAAQGPIVTATGPEIQVHGGFEYIGQQVPGQGPRVPMYGVDSGLTMGLSRHIGLRLDAGYARAWNVYGSGHPSDILSYLGGPVFVPLRTRRITPYLELLLGGARVRGATPDGQGGYLRGYANEFAWAGGGGLDLHAGREFSLRVGADYFRTSYWGPNFALAGQGNIRGVVSFTYYLGGIRK